jgi:oxygen-dependent protoporphyrinogen oxidase
VASIVVVGGGVAGLGCAWRLRRAGHEVEVLERAAEPGGRLRSEVCEGFRLERGARFFTDACRNLEAVAQTLGLGPRLRPVASATGAILRNGRLHAVDPGAPWRLLGSELLSPRAKRRLLRLPLELLRHLPRLDPLRPESAAFLDAEDLAAGLRRRVGQEALECLLAPAFSFAFDVEPEDLSYAFALLALRFLAGGSRLRSLEGGNGLLTRALAEQLPVRTGCEVFSVETETEGAKVRYRTQGRERSVLADAAVMALPGCEVPRVCPKLTPDERGFFEPLRYAGGTIVYLLLERAPATLPQCAVLFPRRERLGLYGLAVHHHQPGVAPAGAGLLSATLTERAAARLQEASDARLGEFVVEQLARTPIGRLAPMRCVVQRWPTQLPRFRAGYLPRLARFLGRIDRSPRLAFAGDYLVGPGVEAALSSGMRAATQIARAT